MAPIPAAAAATIAAYSAIGSAVIGAVAAISSGMQQKKAAELNANIARGQAEQARKAAEERADMYRRNAARRMATMRARMGASGIEMETGSPLLALMDSASEAKRDELRILHGGEAQAWAFEQESKAQTFAGANAMTAAWGQAGSSLLAGVSKAYGSYRTGGKG